MSERWQCEKCASVNYMSDKFCPNCRTENFQWKPLAAAPQTSKGDEREEKRLAYNKLNAEKGGTLGPYAPPTLPAAPAPKREGLRELIAKWRNAAQKARNLYEEQKEIMARGGTVTFEVTNEQAKDQRDICADELEQFLASEIQPALPKGEVQNILLEVCQILGVELGPGLARYIPLIAKARELAATFSSARKQAPSCPDCSQQLYMYCANPNCENFLQNVPVEALKNNEPQFVPKPCCANGSFGDGHTCLKSLAGGTGEQVEGGDK